MFNLEFSLALSSNVFTVGWGSWYDHVKGYWKVRKESNIHYILYEDMKEVVLVPHIFSCANLMQFDLIYCILCLLL